MFGRIVINCTILLNAKTHVVIDHVICNCDRATVRINAMILGADAPVGIDAITVEGETSVVCFEGEVHHAVTKRPAMGDFRVQIEFGGSYTVVEPTSDQVDVAHACMRALDEVPLYARVDMVAIGGQPHLMELELIEPELFMLWVPEAAVTFADAIREQLSFAGLRG